MSTQGRRTAITRARATFFSLTGAPVSEALRAFHRGERYQTIRKAVKVQMRMQ